MNPQKEILWGLCVDPKPETLSWRRRFWDDFQPGPSNASLGRWSPRYPISGEGADAESRRYPVPWVAGSRIPPEALGPNVEALLNHFSRVWVFSMTTRRTARAALFLTSQVWDFVLVRAFLDPKRPSVL